MERTASIEEVKEIFGKNFIGIEELNKFTKYNLFKIPTKNPDIPFSKEYLLDKGNDYVLIYGVSETEDSNPLNLIFLRDKFGVNPDVSEPCFYNQDWYLKEDFMKQSLEDKWYLIKKTVFDDSRAVLPNELQKKYNFPSAILCAYTFFSYWFHTHEILWKHDFVWCSDLDHNGDRIYIGKYIDIDGVNKNGFSIHRHLALRNNYATITFC